MMWVLFILSTLSFYHIQRRKIFFFAQTLDFSMFSALSEKFLEKILNLGVDILKSMRYYEATTKEADTTNIDNFILEAMNMTQTSQEIRNAWNKANYKAYQVNLRVKDDSDLIDKVEKRKAKGQKVAEIFREALEKLED